MKQCEICGKETPSKSDRFCKVCREAKLLEMQMAGYLTPKVKGHIGDHRTEEQKELVRETKFGTGHG